MHPLLCAHGERPYGRTAEKRYEPTSLHVVPRENTSSSAWSLFVSCRMNRRGLFDYLVGKKQQ